MNVLKDLKELFWLTLLCFTFSELRPQLTRQKAVCLHGFRSNGDALAAQMGALISHPWPV